jgi:hypothetical protein
MKTIIFTILFYLINWTWGLLQNIIGFIIYIFISRDDEVELDYINNCFVLYSDKIKDSCYGMFIFNNGFSELNKSIYLGPFYLPYKLIRRFPLKQIQINQDIQ